MKSCWRILVVLSLASIATPASSVAPGTMTVRGQITDWFGFPLAEAVVEVFPQAASRSFEAVTNRDGMYRLDDVPKSVSLTMTARLDGFNSAKESLEGFADDLVWNEGLRLREAAESTWQFRLGGRVVDQRGRPLADVPVRLQAGLSRSFILHDLTNSQGRFSFAFVYSGVFVLSAVSHLKAASQMIVVRPIASSADVELVVQDASKKSGDAAPGPLPIKPN